MPRRGRSAGKWLLRGLALLLLLVALDLLFLAFPGPLFAHTRELGEVTVYSRHPVEDLERTIASTRERVRAMEYARPGAEVRVFICDTQRLYSVFGFLTRRGPDSLAIGVSLLGTVYVNETKVRRMAAYNHGGILHSRFEGNLAGVIAHEIAHFNVVERLGYRAAVRAPMWKSEGYAEHQANLAATRADPGYRFSERIDLLQDTAFWGGADSVARRLFESHVLVEFLAEQNGIGLEELYDAATTEGFAREEMLRWYERHE